MDFPIGFFSEFGIFVILLFPKSNRKNQKLKHIIRMGINCHFPVFPYLILLKVLAKHEHLLKCKITKIPKAEENPKRKVRSQKAQTHQTNE